MMKFKNMLKLFSKTEVQEDKTNPNHLSQTILNRLLGRVLERKGDFHVPSLFKGRLGWVSCLAPCQNKIHPCPPLEMEGVSISCAKHTVKNLFSYSPIHLFTFKKCAFTLAEVLITLAIIGVVAAMTLPTLIQNQQKRALEVATQKFYSTMSQAIRQYMADQGSDDLRNTPIVIDEENYDEDVVRVEKEVDEFFKKYLKAQICENGCFAKNYKTQKGEVSSAVGTEPQDNYLKGRYILPDGMVVTCTGWFLGSTDYPGGIVVDVNGQKGPNKIGYDLWSMSVFYDGTLDEGGVTPNCKKGIPDINGLCGRFSSAHEVRQDFFNSCYNGQTGYGGCFGHFLEKNFKFDY